MSQSDGEITHVSDTALLVAACRALEFECQDGFVHDPFAARLAGERGMAILRGLPQPDMMRFGIAVRRSYITDMEFAMERIRRLMGDRPQPPGPPPVPPDDPTGVQLFARG